jgi:tetrapyrrole methylase family protein / MazG family protein
MSPRKTPKNNPENNPERTSSTSPLPHRSESPTDPDSLEWLVGIMHRLLGPDGCPWDKEQTLDSLKPFLLEEAYEVLDAIEEGDPSHHAEELGDLLFQIVFQAELAGLPLTRVIRSIGEKLIRRHPHVFGDLEVGSSQEVIVNWERIKKTERGQDRGVLAGVPRSMPALQRAHRLTRKAARVGFDWPDIPAVRRKVAEELGELDDAVVAQDQSQVVHEMGDLLFSVVNWARKLGLDPEETLRQANGRFERRFAYIEEALASRGKTPADSTLEEMDALWNEGKALVR